MVACAARTVAPASCRLSRGHLGRAPAKKRISSAVKTRIDQCQPYKISLTDDRFASSKVTGEVFDPPETPRKWLKMYILIPFTRNSENWHSSCTSEEWD